MREKYLLVYRTRGELRSGTTTNPAVALAFMDAGATVFLAGTGITADREALVISVFMED